MSRMIRTTLAAAALSTAITGITLSSGPAQARACGGASYKCVGTANRSYRLAETPTMTRTFACS